MMCRDKWSFIEPIEFFRKFQKLSSQNLLIMKNQSSFTIFFVTSHNDLNEQTEGWSLLMFQSLVERYPYFLRHPWPKYKQSGDMLSFSTVSHETFFISTASISIASVRFAQKLSTTPSLASLSRYTFFIGYSIFHLSLELLTKFWKTSLKVA